MLPTPNQGLETCGLNQSSSGLCASADLFTVASEGPDPFPVNTATVGGIEGLFAAFDAAHASFDIASNCCPGCPRLSHGDGHSAVTPSSAVEAAVSALIEQTQWDGCEAIRFKSADHNGTASNGTDAAVPKARHWRAAPRAVIAAPQPTFSATHETLGSHHGNSRRLAPHIATSVDCTVEDDVPAPRMQWTRTRIVASCTTDGGGGGSYRLHDVAVTGGGSHRLNLKLYVNGVEAMPVRDSWWRFDNRIEYFSIDQISFIRLNSLLLVGHDSFQFLALLSIPIFYLAKHLGRQGRVGLSTLTAMSVLLLFVHYQSTFFRAFLSQIQDPALKPSLFAFGANDLVPVPPAQFFSALCLGVSWLLVTFPMLIAFLLLFSRWTWFEWLVERYPNFTSRREAAWRARQGEKATEKANETTDMSRDGGLEPAVFWEADEMRRRRCARNHVRLLLRGRRWQSMQYTPPPPSKLKQLLDRLWLKLGPKRTQCGPSPRTQVEPFGATAPSLEGIELHQTSLARMELLSRDQSFNARGMTSMQRTRHRLKGLAAELMARHCCSPSPPKDPNEDYLNWNQHSPYEGQESVFYPLRLRMAFALSAWISLLISLVALNLSSWLVTFIESAYQYSLFLSAQALYTDQLWAATRVETIPLLGMLLLAALQPVQHPQTRGTIEGIITASGFLGTFAALGAMLLTWRLIFKNYRRNIFRLRTGNYFFPKDDFAEGPASKFVGYQVAHSTLGYLLTFPAAYGGTVVAGIVLLSLFGVIDHRIFTGIVGTVRTLLPIVVIPLVIPLVFQAVANACFFKPPWIQHRAIYALYDFALIYTNALVGLAAVVSRLALVIGMLIGFFPRLDHSMMPGPTGHLLSLDAGFKAYVAMLKMDHRYTNPVGICFVDLLVERLQQTRRRNRARQTRRSLYKAGAPSPPVLPRAGDSTLSVAPTAAPGRWQALLLPALAKRRQILNRWRLALMLLTNPALRDHRAHKLLRSREFALKGLAV